MKLSDFDYFLPKELIAQEGLQNRDESRLMVLNSSGEKEHLIFKDLTNILKSGDLLVLNDTQVIKAKLIGRKESGGKVDCLILPEMGPVPHQSLLPNTPRASHTPLNRGDKGDLPPLNLPLTKGEKKREIFEVLLRGSKIKTGAKIVFTPHLNPLPPSTQPAGRQGERETVRKELYAEVMEKVGGARFKVKFSDPELIQNFSEIPLPPYIKIIQKDPSRYQTVYSKKMNSLAAPTAGLHFTAELIQNLKNKGVEFVFLTHHIGIGTFAPIRMENFQDYKMHPEYFEISSDSAEKINAAIHSQKRIFAVGTTTVRALESVFNEGKVHPQEGWTELFIYPGYQFKFPYSGMITNFHLPKSTLLLLVCAFAGREKIYSAYKEAIEEKYRFYSFGDAMLILSATHGKAIP